MYSLLIMAQLLAPSCEWSITAPPYQSFDLPQECIADSFWYTVEATITDIGAIVSQDTSGSDAEGQWTITVDGNGRIQIRLQHRGTEVTWTPYQLIDPSFKIEIQVINQRIENIYINEEEIPGTPITHIQNQNLKLFLGADCTGCNSSQSNRIRNNSAGDISLKISQNRLGSLPPPPNLGNSRKLSM